MRCLGIESTAHTFGAAVMEAPAEPGDPTAAEVLSNARSMYEPAEGGIHPREAAEHHYRESLNVVENALAEADVARDDLDCVAFSRGPGMPQSLEVGAVVARTLAMEHSLDLYGANHILGHIEIGRFATGADDPVVLYVSGGNSQVVAYAGGRYRVFGETQDIAIGNALDKFARELGIPHPGGPAIEERAERGDTLHEMSYVVKGMDFSFSGLVTEAQRMHGEVDEDDLCFSFQEHAYAMLVEATERAMAHLGKDEVLLTGGVAANGRLREMLTEMAEDRGAEAFLVPHEHATDNAAMIAWQGVNRARTVDQDPVEVEIRQDWRPEEVAVPWR